MAVSNASDTLDTPEIRSPDMKSRIPLVPGYGIYSTMLNLLQNNLEQGLSLGLNTIFNSGAIAIGVILVSSIAKILKRKNTKKPMTLPRI